jgi:hypothetical protein
MPNEDWTEYRNLVMERLKDFKEISETLSHELNALQTEVTILKTKAAMYGVAGGLAIQIMIFLVSKFL